MDQRRTSSGPGVVLVAASDHGAWRGAVLLVSVGLVFAGIGAAAWLLNMVLIGGCVVLVGMVRAVWSAKVFATSQLVDQGDDLVWMYRGEPRDQVAWAELRHVVFERHTRHVMWSLGPRTGGPFPSVIVDSRACQLSGFRS